MLALAPGFPDTSGRVAYEIEDGRPILPEQWRHDGEPAESGVAQRLEQLLLGVPGDFAHLLLQLPGLHSRRRCNPGTINERSSVRRRGLGLCSLSRGLRSLSRSALS